MPLQKRQLTLAQEAADATGRNHPAAVTIEQATAALEPENIPDLQQLRWRQQIAGVKTFQLLKQGAEGLALVGGFGKAAMPGHQLVLMGRIQRVPQPGGGRQLRVLAEGIAHAFSSPL